MEDLFQKLNTEQKLYQMFILGYEGENPHACPNLTNALKSGLGGVIFFTQNIYDKERFKNAVQMIKDILASGGYDTEYSLGDASLTNADKYIENLHSSIGSSGGGSSSSSKPNYGGYDSLDDFNNAIKDAANQSSSTGDKVYIGNSGLYIDTSKTKKYDSGGVLSGLGGIKATDKDETVFDEKISSMILSPKKSKEFLDSANALTKILENSSGLNRLMQILSCGISGNKSYSDSHNIIINGDISQKISDNDYNTISAVLKRYIPITKG